MRTLVAVAGLVAVLGWATTAGAAEGKEGMKFGKGAFVSAQVAGEVVKWELDLGGDAGKKTLEMSKGVMVQYIEKEGAKLAQGIRPVDGKAFKEREGAVVTKGTFASAKLEGEKVMVTITPAEGEKALEVTLPAQLGVMYREGEGGKLTALSVGIPRQRAPKGDGK